MNKKIWCYICDVFSLCVLVFLDQFTKAKAVTHLANQEPYVLIQGIFELHYLENKGAAFGMLQNGKVFFIFAAVIMMTLIAFVLWKAPKEKKYLPWHVFLIMICAGGIGNMTDRIRLEYVIDFFYLKCIDFPIFNVADIYITVGTALLVIYLLFFLKEEDLFFLSTQKK